MFLSQFSLLQWFFWVLLFFSAVFSMTPVEYLGAIPIFDWWDKAQHALAFAILGFLAWLAFPQNRSFSMMALLIYGGLIEILQWLTPWRFGEWADWLADVLGLSIVILLGLIFKRKSQRIFY